VSISIHPAFKEEEECDGLLIEGLYCLVGNWVK